MTYTAANINAAQNRRTLVLGGVPFGMKLFSDGVIVVNEKGEEEKIEADTVVTAFGGKADAAKIGELADVIPDTYIVGDAKKTGVIGDAINQAYWLCREL